MLGSSKGTKTKLLEVFFSGTTCQRCIDLLEWHTSLAQASCALEGVLPISSAHIYPKLDTGSTHTGRDLLPFSFAIACSNSTECLWPHWLCTEWLSESMRLCRNTDFPFPLHVCERDSTDSTCLGKKKKNGSATHMISQADKFHLLLWQSGKILFSVALLPIVTILYSQPEASAWVWSVTYAQSKLGIWWVRCLWKPLISSQVLNSLPKTWQGNPLHKMMRRHDHGPCYSSTDYGDY